MIPQNVCQQNYAQKLFLTDVTGKMSTTLTKKKQLKINYTLLFLKLWYYKNFYLLLLVSTKFTIVNLKIFDLLWKKLW